MSSRFTENDNRARIMPESSPSLGRVTALARRSRFIANSSRT